MRLRVAVIVFAMLVVCNIAHCETITWLWDDFNGNYPGAFNGFIEEHFKSGDLFATHYYLGDHNFCLPPHTGSDKAQQFVYYQYTRENGFVTYIETMSDTNPEGHIVDLVRVMALRGQDPMDQTKPATYRIRVYGHNDAFNPDDPIAYWKQMLEVQLPTVKRASINWTSANNDTWQTLEVTQTWLDGGKYQWITLDSWYPGAENGETNYFALIKSASYMNWENLEIEYTPLPPLYSNMIVVADPNDIPGFFHVENEARTFGMRFRYIAGNVIVPKRGDRVNLWGTLERQLPDKAYRANTVKILSSGNPLPEPLAMSMKNAGGKPEVTASQGPLNNGLLVKLSGKITYVGSGYVYISDGSNVPYGDSVGAKGVKVFTSRTDLSLNKFITATGIVELAYYTEGKMPVIRTRNADDIIIRK